MQALRIYFDKTVQYFCSTECANEEDCCEEDGEFVLETDCPNNERCAHCDIFLNDRERAIFQGIRCADVRKAGP